MRLLHDIEPADAPSVPPEAFEMRPVDTLKAGCRMDADVPIDETGILVREGGGFCLRRDVGGQYRLELPRMPVDEVEKRVRVIGTLLSVGHVLVEGVSLTDR
jgi:hypothetical protein